MATDIIGSTESYITKGSAVVYANGYKAYWIHGKELTESEFAAWQAQQDAPLHNKTATIDGVEYTLIANNS
jgi:hypothetical protein